ncbi:hypothetical protein [Mangrovimonas sp. TPBH4]|uniref:hypothetical protein n=1 Tax=Mangrovimonas sp. TPBH4 TaxID=1645914 RepID=UPI0006B6903A|nr:hypothetical protein [Mangrovimonas sp. TPBH4]
MDSNYYKIYENLYADYLYDWDRQRRVSFYTDYDFIKTIRRSIDRADTENNLRPDAKYFLMVNFHHLIVRPLMESRLEIYFPNHKEFLDLEYSIQTDIGTIISESIKDNKEDVSGHQIMKTIDNLWRELRTTRLEIWG